MEKDRYKIITAINAPLGFFVLALLIIETFLGLVLTVGKLPAPQTMMGIYLGVGMFVCVIIAVFMLVWYKAENLILDQHNQLDLKKFMIQQDKFKGTSEKDINTDKNELPTQA